MKKLYINIKNLDEALKIIADQDMKIGKLTRENEYMQDTIYKFNECQRERKKQAGYHDSISFDIVWNEILKKAQSHS